MAHQKIQHKSLLAFSLLLLAVTACGRAPLTKNAELAPLSFGTSTDDLVNDLARHSSGVYAVGATHGNLHGTNSGGSDAIIRRYDANGGVSWGRQFGTNGTEYGEDVASDASDNAYVTGFTTGSLAGLRGGEDAFLRKYTPSGSVVWTQQFGTSAHERAFNVAVQGSNIYVVGITNGPLQGLQQGGGDAYIIKYNASGAVVWIRQFGTGTHDLANGVAVDASGNVYISGYTSGALSGVNAGGRDMFLRKYNSSGAHIWTYQNPNSKDDVAAAVAVDPSGNILLAGVVQYGPNDLDVRILKLNPARTKLWEKPFQPFGDDHVGSVSTDSSGNVYFAGVTHTSLGGPNQGGGDGYVIKLNSSGTQIWGKQLGTSGDDIASSVLARSSSEIYVAGWTNRSLGGSNHGGYDGFLTRLSGSSSNTVWIDQ